MAAYNSCGPVAVCSTGLKADRAQFPDVSKALEKVALEKGYQLHQNWLNKCIQLYETYLVSLTECGPWAVAYSVGHQPCNSLPIAFMCRRHHGAGKWWMLAVIRLVHWWAAFDKPDACGGALREQGLA